MSRLLRAEGYLCRIPASAITISDNGSAGDEGCDGWSPGHQGRSDWLPEVDTCWQLKSGAAGEPAKLKGEVLKPIPRSTLQAGGAYIIVASKSSGRTAAEKRLEVVRQDAQEAGLPTERIRVYTCETLEGWCNSIAAISMGIAGVPHTFLAYDDWVRDRQHAGPFHVCGDVAGRIVRARHAIDLLEGPSHHLLIHGQPGLGRTRLAMEIVRGTGLEDFALYVPTYDQHVAEFLGQVRVDSGSRLLLVVDHVPPEAVRVLDLQTRIAEGRIRLITISSDLPTEREGIEILSLEQLDSGEMQNFVQHRASRLHFEHLDFVVRFAEGSIKLAMIALRTLEADPDVQGLESLLRQHDVRGFLDRLLGSIQEEDRRALEAVALLSRVGWDDEVEDQGKALIEALGLNWSDVRHRIRRIDEQAGLVPQAGRYRYVSPPPLAALLARGALEDYRRILPQLPERLPHHEARVALIRRMVQLSDHPGANVICRRLHDRFRTLADLERRDGSELWDLAATADPTGAIETLRRMLELASPAEKDSFVLNGSGALWTLEKQLARRSETFTDAMLILADLAVLERGRFGFSPTRAFCERYRVILAGTEVPFSDRLRLLDGLLSRREPAYSRLVIRALATAINRLVAPTVVDGNPWLRPVAPQWGPRDRDDEIRARREALVRLIALADAGAPDHEDLLVKATTDALPLMQSADLVDDVRMLVERMLRSYPGCREILESRVASHLDIEEQRRGRDPSFVATLRALQESVAEGSFRGRLRQHAGRVHLGASPAPASLAALADEIIEQPDLIGREWGWLTSGEAHNVTELGRALGERDRRGAVAAALDRREGRGPDLRLIAAYVNARSEHQSDGWSDDWLEERAMAEGGDPELVLAVIGGRGASTTRSARLVLDMLRAGSLPRASFGYVPLTRWGRSLPGPEARELIAEIVRDPASRPAALLGIYSRLEQDPGEIDELEPLAADLATDPASVVPQGISAWQGVARHLVPRHARAIAAAAFAARCSGPFPWYAPDPPDGEILFACAAADPEGVWMELSRSLEEPDDRHGFASNLPIGLVDRLPQDQVLGWAASSPDRVLLLARLAAPNFQDDRSLAAVLADLHGHRDDVSRALIGQMSDWRCYGVSRQQWAEHADGLEQVTRTTRREGLRRWARSAAEACRAEEERCRIQEEEGRMEG